MANGAGLPTTALITDMNQVLGRAAGNGLEVAECVSILRGEPGEPRLMRVTVALGGALLAAAGVAPDAEAGAALVNATFSDGRAAERFGRMVTALGGPADLVDAPDRHLQRAPVIRPVPTANGGTVRRIDIRALGFAIVAMGGGRQRLDDEIDHPVGLTDVIAPGDTVETGAPLATIHAASEESWAQTAEQIAAAIEIGEGTVTGGGDVVLETIEIP